VGLAVTTICWVTGDGRIHDFRRVTPPGTTHDEVDRLVHLRCLVEEAGMSLPAPDVIVVERPTGKYPKQLLVMAAGVIADRLASLTLAPVFLCAVQEWKKATVGKGNASKEECMEWALGEGVETESQDDADAYGLARFALAEGRRETA
jgi:Holliday junction resolvasome RuvABC endonuclease subunit